MSLTDESGQQLQAESVTEYTLITPVVDGQVIQQAVVEHVGVPGITGQQAAVATADGQIIQQVVEQVSIGDQQQHMEQQPGEVLVLQTLPTSSLDHGQQQQTVYTNAQIGKDGFIVASQQENGGSSEQQEMLHPQTITTSDGQIIQHAVVEHGLSDPQRQEVLVLQTLPTSSFDQPQAQHQAIYTNAQIGKDGFIVAAQPEAGDSQSQTAVAEQEILHSQTIGSDGQVIQHAVVEHVGIADQQQGISQQTQEVLVLQTLTTSSLDHTQQQQQAVYTNAQIAKSGFIVAGQTDSQSQAAVCEQETPYPQTLTTADGQVIQHAVVEHMGISDQQQSIDQQTQEVLVLHTLPISSRGSVEQIQQQQPLYTKGHGNKDRAISSEQQENIDPRTQTITTSDGQVIHNAVVQHVGIDGEEQMDGQEVLVLHTLPITTPSVEDGQQQQENDGNIIKPPVGKGPFKCDLCPKIFPKWGQLQRHLRIHDDDKPYRCADCPMTFNIEDNLVLHAATHNLDNAQCPECGKKFARIASLKAHIMLHEKEENLMCTECGDEFCLQSQLDRHMQEHRQEQEGSRVYPCRQCTQEFSALTLLREHQRQHNKIKHSLSHKTYKRNIDRSGFPHKCTHCGKSFLKPSQLERHVRIHTGEKPFKCSICDRAFNQKGALQIHMTKHTGQRPYLCEFCPATFAQRGNLRAHIKRVHSAPKESDAPSYQCEECSCVFKKLGTLNAHMSRAHSDPSDAPTQVEVQRQGEGQKNVNDVIQQLLELSEQVTDPEAAQQQIQQIAADVNVSSDILQQALVNSGVTVPADATQTVDKMAASIVAAVTGGAATSNAGATSAGNTTTSTTNSSTSGTKQGIMSTMTIHDPATGTLKRHVIRKANGIRWHQCTYCSKEFKKPSDLVRHIRIHTHEKPYKCTQCFRSFAVKSTLTAHVKTHSGIKEFKCHVCHKMFSTQGSLKVHLRLHTGAKPFDCPHCYKKFRTSGHRKAHMQSHFKDSSPRKPRRHIKRNPKPEIPLPDIPLQEPILITDTGLIQQAPRNSQVYNQYLGDASSVDRPYKCGYCSRGFKKSSHLKQHIRSHTGEKPYKCLQCMRSFVSSGVLKAHIRTHSGIKAYKCLICDTTFTTNGSLKRHMSTHSEVRPFMCPYCQKTFKTSVNCKKHMKTHRHELAMQALQQQDGSLGPEGPVTAAEVEVQIQDSGQDQADMSQALPHDAQLGSEQQTFTLAQPDLTQQTLTQQDLGQAALTQETVIQDSLVDTQLQNTLNPQQVFGQQTVLGQQQTFVTNQQTFNQLNYSQNQFTLQAQQVQGIDVNSLGGFSQTNTNVSVNGGIPSTPIQNILQTKEPELTPAQRQRQIVIQQEMEDGKRSYKCGYCNKAFKKSSHLKQHIRSHTGEKPYKCMQCGRMFVSTGVLRAHMKTHSGMKDFKCPICQASFTTNGSLTRHMMIHSSIRPFKCPYCPETYRTSVHCKRHMKTHRDGRVDGEGERSQRRSRSAIIQITDEQAEELSKANPEDDMSVSEKLLIQSAAEKDRISEVKDQTTEPPKGPKHPHQCEHCTKSFKKPSDLVRHIRIHTGEKPFPCEICSRSFTVKSTLDSHMKTHQAGEKLFKCHVCTSSFSTKGSLKVHMRLHTGAKPFKCPHCDQRFRTSGHRKSHIASHFRPNTPKKRKAPTRSTENAQPSINVVTTQPMDVHQLSTQNIQAPGPNPVISVDQSMLQGQNIMPLSLSIQDSLGSLGETGLAAQVLQGLEGIQLQLTTGSLGQGIQITGLDPSLLSQTVQIDASLLQQLQQQGNLNLAINPNIFTQTLATADPNLVQNIQIQPAETLNPNVIVQPLLATAGQTIITREAGVPPTATEVSQEVAGTSYSVVTEQQLQAQVQEQGELVQVEHVVAQALDEDKQHAPQGDLEDEQSVIVHEGVSEDNLEQHLQSDINLANDQSQGNLDNQLDPERTHICLLCNKAFKRAGHLKEHALIHAPGISAQRLKPTPHKCTTCDKSFSKPSQLERHIRIHTGERPFVCNICLKAFNQKNALQIHLKKHSGERPHKCPYCGLAFTQKGNLKTHIKRAHHLEMVQSMNLPKASNASLGSESGLETHQEEGETSEVAEHQEAAPQEGEAIDFEGVVRELFPQ